MIAPLHYDLFQRINHRLDQTLPGTEAHYRMAPPGRFKKDRSSHYKPNPKTRQGGVLILLYPKEGELHFPLILRPENTGVHSGQMALPGGKLEPSDRDIIHTALRETQEEVGVPVEPFHVLGQLSQVYIPPSNFMVSPTIAALNSKPEFVPEPGEVDKVFEIKVNDLRDQNLQVSKMMRFGNFQVEVPCFELENQIVWGATAMILNEFLAVLEEL